jgi:HEAT repeat protein
MLKHLEPPLFQDQYFFGKVQGNRIIKPASLDSYCDELIELLGHRKSRFRWIAADQLGKLQQRKAVESLIMTLNDGQWLVRLHGAKALGRIGDSRAIHPLIKLSADQNSFVRRRVITALGHWNDNEQVFKVLASATQDSDKKVRYRAITSLIEVENNPQVVDVLLNAVEDEDENVSRWALKVLQRRKESKAVIPLTNMLTTKDGKLLHQVIVTLGYIGDERAIKPLTQLSKHSDIRIGGRARFALEQIEYRMSRQEQRPA